MSNTATVYIAISDEGVNAWRPVQAKHVGDSLYRLTGNLPDDEALAFAVGDVVKCRLQRLSGDGHYYTVLVAYEKATGSWDSIPSSLRWTE